MACFSKWFKTVGGVSRSLSCGRCIGCKLEYSRQWAVRCMHEASMHEENCFITLTYKDAPFSLDYRDFQLFMKRLRRAYPDKPCLFYMCGEYGDRFNRPHFHALLFGLNFEDRKYFKLSDSGKRLYTSVILDRLWSHGYCWIGAAEFESAAYIARYVCKRQDGKDMPKLYEDINVETGEVRVRVPEFGNMSRRRGLGKSWFEKFGNEVLLDGEVLVRGHLARAPRFYDRLIKVRDFGAHARISTARALESVAHLPDSTPARLSDREKVVKAGSQRFPKRLT